MANSSQSEFSTLLPEAEPASYSTVDNRSPVPPASDSMLHEPKQIGRYRILRVLGQGGMGKVYEAHDTKLERTVALKVMLADAIAQPDARDRFLREARTMAKVRSDHVVAVFDVDEAGDTPYLAMEFLHGQSLASWIGHGERPRIADVVRIGREIASGLAAAQAKGLIHRDIKPANLWLEGSDGKSKTDHAATDAFAAPTLRVKILDFGLARPVSQESSITQSGAIMGTPYYMSPEQARGKPVDGRSDLFSLGVVLYQLCTGTLPFSGSNVTAVLTALAVDIPPPILAANPYVPKALADLVMWLLEKDPALRPQSAGQVVAALKAIEGQLPEDRGMLQRAAAGDAAATPTLGPTAALSSTLPSDIRTTNASERSSSRNRWVGIAALALGLVGAIAAGASYFAAAPNGVSLHGPGGPPIRLGILYSRTGRMAVSERSILDGVTLAVQEINDAGGVLGRPLEIVTEDGRSDEIVFAHKAGKLIDDDKVAALFGCWTSASRKTVGEVVEKRDSLLFHPSSYEGMESSPNIIYGGAVPNQQVLPALRWTRGFMNKTRWYLIGLDAIHSRGTHAVIRDEAANMGATIVGEELLSTENNGIGDIVERIEKAKPDLYVNTVKGETNAALFRALDVLRPAGKKIPILSFAVSETELANLTPEELEGHLAANTYFHSIDSSRNREFLKLVEKRFGADYVVSDQMQSMYALVHLWAIAANAAGTENCQAVRKALHGLEYDAPQGRVTVDPTTQHLVQTGRVGSLGDSGRFEDVYVSPQRMRPEPFPASRTRAEWEAFVKGLHEHWGGRWHNLAERVPATLPAVQ